MDDREFGAWCDAQRLPEDARSFIGAIRASPPVRHVRGGRGNVSGIYPSEKMGWGTQFEGHRTELPGIIAMEYGADYLEFYDQPRKIKLTYTGPDGKNRGHLHTPDFFWIRTDDAGFDEWKTEEELEGLAAENPHRYCRDEAGRWRCPPGEAAAAEYGVAYRVRTDADIDWIWIRNMIWLEDYLREDALQVDGAVADALSGRVRDEPGLALADLLADAAALGGDADAIHALIVLGRLYVDLRRAPLAHPIGVRVFHSEAFAQAHAIVVAAEDREVRYRGGQVRIEIGAKVRFEGREWMIVNTTPELTSLVDDGGRLIKLRNDIIAACVDAGELTGIETEKPAEGDNPALERLLYASPQALETALRRFDALINAPETLPERTRRDWRAKERAGEELYGSGLLGLLDGLELSGNYTPRFTVEEERLIAEGIAKYETDKQISQSAAYAHYLDLCEQALRKPCSYRTFAKRVHARPQYEQAKSRKGRRGAYQHAIWHWYLTMTTPRHGDRAWEVAHIDHTQLDIELVDSETGQNLGKPWATFLMDAKTRRLLARVLTFDPPSYRSCFLVLRECVRRYGRLPQILVLDGGKEFRGGYFRVLAAAYRLTVKYRPPAAPHFGSVLERLFGTANTEFLYRLAGNTQIMKNVRLTTKANDPKRLACWTLRALDTAMGHWQDLYNSAPHPALGQSPDDAWAASEARAGKRGFVLVRYDETFQILTLPTTTTGQATVQEGRGVKINHIYYHHHALTDRAVVGTKVPVRYEPYDIGTAYAYVGRRWVRCRSEYYLEFRGHTERELRLVTEELRERQHGHPKARAITGRRLADLMAANEATESLLLQRRRDAEARGLRDRTVDEPGVSAATAPVESGAPPAVRGVPAAATATDEVADDNEFADNGEYQR